MVVFVVTSRLKNKGRNALPSVCCVLCSACCVVRSAVCGERFTIVIVGKTFIKKL